MRLEDNRRLSRADGLKYSDQLRRGEGLRQRVVGPEQLGIHERPALGRIRRLKERYLLPYQDPDPRAARGAAGMPQSLALAQEIEQLESPGARDRVPDPGEPKRAILETYTM